MQTTPDGSAASVYSPSQAPPCTVTRPLRPSPGASGAFSSPRVAGADADCAPGVASVGQRRTRLETRLEQDQKQRGWGDLSDPEYQAPRDEVRARLSELPDGDRIANVDAYRATLLALPAAIDAASPERREELWRMLVERVVVRDRRAQSIEWTPAARAFFEKWQRECPQGGSGTRPLSDEEDVLAWYVA